MHRREKAETVAIEGYQKKQPEKKEEVTKVILSSDLRPQIKEVGHIDLENKHKTITLNKHNKIIAT